MIKRESRIQNLKISVVGVRQSMNELERYTATYNELLSDGHLMYAGLLLERAARLWPTKRAVICDGEQVTYKELFERALRVSAHCNQRGIAAENRVILLYENSINFYVAYHALWQMGAIVVPVNTLLHAREIALIQEKVQPAAIIISDNLLKKMPEITSSVPLVVTETDLNQYQQDTVIPAPTLTGRDPHLPSVILYTSGTTGVPKGVMLSSHNILINSIQGSARFTIQPHDMLLGALPLFHSYMQNTCLWLTTLFGLTAIIVPKIDRAALVQALSYRPTVIVGIPQLYGLFCLMKTIEWKNIRYFISGGDALPNKIRMTFELIYRRKICNGFGLTETSPFLSVDLDDITKPPETVGKPFIGVSCEIRDEQGAIQPPYTKGILWVKGENIMLGYYNAPQATNAVLVDGWLNTGDLAFLTDEGKIVLCGREKDLIKSKGVKVYPQEIENILMLHPQVMAAAVIGRKKEDEEIPVAYIAAKSPSSDLSTQLRDLCQEHLASYEIPRIFIIRESLPMTATGKIDKKLLRKEQEADGA